MTKDYTPKNTDFVWNGDESKHTEARKMLARKVREKFGTIGDWYTVIRTQRPFFFDPLFF